jgi:hypothetical protein
LKPLQVAVPSGRCFSGCASLVTEVPAAATQQPQLQPAQDHVRTEEGCEAEDKFPAFELHDRDKYESWNLLMKFALEGPRRSD